MVYFEKSMIYTNKFINIISLIITIIIFTLSNFLVLNNSKSKNEIFSSILDKIEEKHEGKKNVISKKEDMEIGDWYVEISSISLKAPIAEGTSMEVLNENVGHFTETSKDIGNVGLAAHNRGFKKNYFENLKDVQINDEIRYKCKEFEKIYKVDKIEIIKNTDWSYLDKTEENKITLITCIENQPEFRRCVQASEIN